MKGTVLTLNLLALPALAAAAGLHHPGASASPATLTAATESTAVSAATVAACQAWEPLIPGLLYLETTPIITLGGVPLLGGGTCEPTGKGYDISLGAGLAIPPGSACSSAPLIKVNIGLAIGVPDENGTDPCQAPAAPAAAVAPRVVPPSPPQVVPPAPPQVVPPLPPQVVPPVAPSAPALAPPPPAQSAPALAPPPPAPVRRPPPPPATTPAPPATTPAAVVPPPPPPRRPGPPKPAPPAPVAAVAAPVTHAPKPARHKPAPRKPVPEATFIQAAPAPPAPTFKPGQPVLPVGVLVTVVMTPCVATVAARLGKIMAGHAG
jgi:hypothetical protein